MGRKRKSKDGGGGLPLWMATYGDMVTLLLCFFVLLYSFSTLDTVKFQALANSFQQAFNVQSGGSTMNQTPGIQEGSFGQTPGDSPRETQGNDAHIARQMKTIVKELDVEKSVTVTQTERGVVISLTDQVLFADGSAELQPAAARILYKIGGALQDIPNNIAIEGHTDNAVLGAESIYKNNWALSSARAAAVAAYLDDRIRIDPTRLQSVGSSSARPIVPNDTANHRLLNRRVDLVILSVHNVR